MPLSCKTSTLSPTLAAPADTARLIAVLSEACEAALEHILDTAGAENELSELLQAALDGAAPPGL